MHANEHFQKDNSIEDFYFDWTIEKTCDTITLESSRPLHLGFTEMDGKEMFYTHECKDDEIAYFKVDVNRIFNSFSGNLGNVYKTFAP